MSFPSSFEPNVAAVMEALAKTAVAEISKLVSDGTTVLRMEIIRRDSEIQELKASLKMLEAELCKTKEAGASRETLENLEHTAANQNHVKDEADDQETFADHLQTTDADWQPQGDSVQDSDTKPVVKCEPPDEHETTWGAVTLETVKADDSLWRPPGSSLFENNSVDMEHEMPRRSQTFPSRHDRRCHRNTERPVSSRPIAAEEIQSDSAFVQLETWSMRSGRSSAASARDDWGGGASEPAFTGDYASESTSQQTAEEHGVGRRTRTLQRVSPKGLTCSVCDRRFLHSFDLESHMVTHQAARPFKCLKCGMSFKHKNRFKTHQRVHTGEKPFSCQICSMQFSRKDNCLRHQRSHSGLKPHKCGVCGKSFTLHFHLRRHQELHLRR